MRYREYAAVDATRHDFALTNDGEQPTTVVDARQPNLFKGKILLIIADFPRHACGLVSDA